MSAGEEKGESNSPNAPEDENLSSLSNQLSDSTLKSSTRILILISLTMNKKLSFVQLLALTGMGKGSLENHLEKLAASGYITTRNVKTFGGTRQFVEITEKGLETTKSLLRTLKTIELE
jgi:DNA-binding MarR family transcriptional regulator